MGSGVEPGLAMRLLAAARAALSLAAFVALVAGASACQIVHERGTLAMNLGLFDFDDSKREFEGGVEYRSFDLIEGLRPVVGATLSTEASVYGYAGLRWEVPWIEPIRVAPSFAVSVFGRGRGKDLGHPVEFRSGVDIGYRFANGLSITAGIYHLSNAGLSARNPGANSLVLSYGYDF